MKTSAEKLAALKARVDLKKIDPHLLVRLGRRSRFGQSLNVAFRQFDPTAKHVDGGPVTVFSFKDPAAAARFKSGLLKRGVKARFV